MEIGRLTEIDFLSPIIHSSYNSIMRKSQSITYKLETILTVCVDIKVLINEYDNIYIAGEIGDYFEKMYSCMEYTASILKELFRDKGTLQASYHDILKRVIKNEDSAKFLSDKALVNFVEGTLSWYAIVHDTRSEEAHFTMGEMTIINETLFYKIPRITGRETVYDLIRDKNGENAEREVEYKISIDNLKSIYFSYINSIKELEILMERKLNE